MSTDWIIGAEGYQWRTSVTFVPDPNHAWDLQNDYAVKLAFIRGDFKVGEYGEVKFEPNPEGRWEVANTPVKKNI